MKIAVIGAGPVGTSLGDKLQAVGHEIKYGTRSPDSDKTAKTLSEHPGTTAAAVPDACTWAEAVVLAAPGSNDDEGIIALGKSLGDGVAGKLIIDATNPLSPFPAGLEVRWTQTKSGAEILQEAVPTAKIVKAFNTIGQEHMVHPDGSEITGVKLTMLFACDPEVKDAAAQIVSDAGWGEMVDGCTC
ncbi:unnamed protein product [Discosporangium mesarthrocarpum]